MVMGKSAENIEEKKKTDRSQLTIEKLRERKTRKTRKGK